MLNPNLACKYLSAHSFPCSKASHLWKSSSPGLFSILFPNQSIHTSARLFLFSWIHMTINKLLLHSDADIITNGGGGGGGGDDWDFLWYFQLGQWAILYLVITSRYIHVENITRYLSHLSLVDLHILTTGSSTLHDQQCRWLIQHCCPSRMLWESLQSGPKVLSLLWVGDVGGMLVWRVRGCKGESLQRCWILKQGWIQFML